MVKQTLFLDQEHYLKAWSFAAEAHQGQNLPGSELPYIVHLGSVTMEVIATLAQEAVPKPNLAIQCALLHDVLEDTEVTFAQLKDQFGQAVADGVQALSKDDRLPKTDAMLESLKRIQKQPQEVWMVKMADRITNLQPPPSHWPTEKCCQYRDEAKIIVNALRSASILLTRRLEAKIANYSQFCIS
ncbi:HD domain-containing protein [Magnetococcales bacterium HHB-1]